MRIHTRVCHPITFERYGQDAAKDRNFPVDYPREVNQVNLLTGLGERRRSQALASPYCKAIANAFTFLFSS